MDLKSVKIGFIGFGNMAQAMAEGWLRDGTIQPEQLFASARNLQKLQRNTEAYGLSFTQANEELVENVDVVILAVKPHQIKEVVTPLKEQLREKVVVSVAVNLPFSAYEELLLPQTSHLSVLPNTPVAVNEGITIFEETHSLSEKEYRFVEILFSLLGLVQSVETSQMGIAGTIAGCGPAFASVFIEALGDAAVKHGLNREAAYHLASQMLVGTGKLQVETGEHPGAMKDAVTSPGGTTIKGVTALEKHGFRGAVIEAIDAIEETT